MGIAKILIIGDSCRDVFMYGTADRICPDAPVPVFITKEIKQNGGMAKNVYENIVSLNLDCDFITNEEEVTKTRFIDKKTNHMFLRVDSGEEKVVRIRNLKKINFKDYDAVIISDYNKGFLTDEDIEFVCDNHACVFIDTKKLLNSWYKKAKFIKINQTEFEKTKHLVNNTSNIIVTTGNEGVLFDGEVFPVKKVEVKDVVGAGDTFLASLVFKYVQAFDIVESIKFANECAAEVVQHKGVTTIGKIKKFNF